MLPKCVILICDKFYSALPLVYCHHLKFSPLHCCKVVAATFNYFTLHSASPPGWDSVLQPLQMKMNKEAATACMALGISVTAYDVFLLLFQLLPLLLLLFSFYDSFGTWGNLYRWVQLKGAVSSRYLHLQLFAIINEACSLLQLQRLFVLYSFMWIN